MTAHCFSRRCVPGRWKKRRAFTAVKAFSLFALIVAFATSLPSAAAQGKVSVIKLWDYHIHDKKFRQNIFKDFNAANPDIRVEYTSQVSSTYTTMLDAAFQTGTPPDIFSQPGGATLDKLVEMGWITALDDLAPSKAELQKWMSRFPQDQQPFADNLNMIGGKVYSWPISASGGYMMLFWNTKLFTEAGLAAPSGGPATPETIDDVRLFAGKITELGQGKIYGIVHGIKQPGIWDQDLFRPAAYTGWELVGYPHFGFDFRTATFDYHHAGLRKYIQLWLDMKKEGSILPGDLSMDDEQAKYKFSQDLAGMIFGGYWVPGGLIALNPSLEFDTVLPPVEKRGERKGGEGMGPLAGSSEYVVSSKVASRGAAWRVISFMTSQQYQEGWVKAGGGFSVFPEYNKSEYFPHPTIAKISQMTSTGRRTQPQQTRYWGKIFTELMDPGAPDLYNTMQGMWVGKLGWDAWDDLERRLNKAFDTALAEAKKMGLNVSKADFTFPDWDPAQNYPPPKVKK